MSRTCARRARPTSTSASDRGRLRYEPRFTFHGFRYVEVDGPDAAKAVVTGVQINSDIPGAGAFACSNENVNRLYDNIVWSQRSNFLSVPTDCPQRDERLGWLADAQIFWPTASFNMDVAAFFTKWVRDILDTQFEDGAFTDVAPSKPHWAHRPFPAKGAPAWGDGAVILIWHHYCFYGDIDLVRSSWASLVRWMDYIERYNPSLIRETQTNNNYGDWLTIGASTPKAVVATAYWAHLAQLMARLASVIGDSDRHARFEELFGRISRAFSARFVSPDGRIEGDTQTGYLIALEFGLADAGQTDCMRAHLRRAICEAGDHLALGFLGVRHVCPVLSDIGEADLAYKLLLNETYPSWLFQVVNGATTIWERWDGWMPGRGFQAAAMNSLNHYVYGAVGEWLFRRVAGIDLDPDRPGFERVLLRPLPTQRLDWARAVHRSHLGQISARWEFAGPEAKYQVALPPNTCGVVSLPTKDLDCVRLDGEPVAGHRDVIHAEAKGGLVLIEIGSGDWVFQWPAP